MADLDTTSSITKLFEDDKPSGGSGPLKSPGATYPENSSMGLGDQIQTLGDLFKGAQ